MSDPVTFRQCLRACWHNDRFMAKYRRLSGSTIGLPDDRTPMAQLIDEATGRTAQGVPLGFAEWVAFVWDAVWMRLPADARGEE